MDAAIEFATLITWHIISVALIGRLGDEPLPVGTWLVYAFMRYVDSRSMMKKKKKKKKFYLAKKDFTI